MIKPDLRRQFLAKRRALTPTKYDEKNAKLVEQVLKHVNWKQVKSMHCFLPLTHDNEPDMRPVIEFAMQRGVAVYTSDPPTKTGRHVLKLHDDYFQSRIHQFAHEHERVFDLIIVPMLAYDPKTYHRLGFGGGFYDRMLARQPQARKIGVCFKEFTTTLPHEWHDQPLDEVITA